MEESLRTMVVVNPQSQGGRTKARWGALADTIRRHYGPFEFIFTRGPGDGAHQARQAAAAGFELVVAMGGDGTIGEVADGLVAASPTGHVPALGILPAGTGGDFRRTLGLPRTLADAASALRSAPSEPIDVGRVEYLDLDGKPAVRHFLNIASFGVSGLVDELVNRSSKKLGGRLSFFWATVKAQGRYHNQAVRLRIDEGPVEERVIHNVAVANGRYFGGGMKIAPDAALDDGQFDIVELGDLTRGELLRSGLSVYRGGHLGHPKVFVRRGRALSAEPAVADEVVLIDIDGEAVGKLPARFSILPRALRIKMPRQAPQ